MEPITGGLILTCALLLLLLIRSMGCPHHFDFDKEPKKTKIRGYVEEGYVTFYEEEVYECAHENCRKTTRNSSTLAYRDPDEFYEWLKEAEKPECVSMEFSGRYD